MRYRDDGEAMLNPIAPSPMYALQDGRYLVFLQNHDGFGYGGQRPAEPEQPASAVSVGG